MSGSVNSACESLESSAGRRHGGKSLNSRHTPCLVVQGSDRELVLDPVGVKKHTHKKKGRGGGAGWGRWAGRVYGLKVDALTKEASSTNGHKPRLSLLSFECSGAFAEELL